MTKHFVYVLLIHEKIVGVFEEHKALEAHSMKNGYRLVTNDDEYIVAMDNMNSGEVKLVELFK